MPFKSNGVGLCSKRREVPAMQRGRAPASPCQRHTQHMSAPACLCMPLCACASLHHRVACSALIEQVELAAAQRQERLEAELHGHKTNLIKESIRQSHNMLGDFFYSRGDLQVRAALAAGCWLRWVLAALGAGWRRFVPDCLAAPPCRCPCCWRWL